MSNGRKVLLYIVYLVLVIALGVGIFFAFHKSNDDKPVVKTPLTTKTQSPDAKNPVEKPETTQPSQSAEAAGKAIQSAFADNTPSSLANTGPGSVIALFAVTAVAGTLAYQRLLRSKFEK